MKSVTSDGTYQMQLVKEGQQQPAMLHQNFFITLVIGNLSYTRVTSLPKSFSTCFYSQEKNEVRKSKSQQMFPMHNFVLIHENSKIFDIQQGYHHQLA